MIHLKTALETMQNTDEKGRPIPFDIIYCTADVPRNVGGEIIELSGVILTWANKKEASKSLNEMTAAMDPSNSKRPKHYKNRTRNFLLPNGGIRKAHISLILKFNGYDVL